MKKRHFLKAAFIASAVALAPMAALAEDVVLTLTGSVNGGTVTLTDSQLSELPQVSFTTTTIWTDGPQAFSGPSLADVLALAGAASEDLTMTAINDYAVEMPAGTVEPTTPILAIRMNGEPFSVREKGPIWLVFNYDSDRRFQNEEIYAYSIWQLDRIHVGAK